MNATTAIIATVICYAVLGILLLSLNLTSLWRWWVKAAAIVITALAGAGTYFAITGLLGWPSHDAMPARFSLLASRVTEPDPLRNDPGHIYLWVEEIDENQIVISPPRGYEVPFHVDLAFEVEKAQESLDTGGSVLGEFDTDEAEATVEGETTSNDEELQRQAGGNNGGTATGEGERFEGVQQTPSLNFSDMPPVSLPAKPDIN